MHYRHVKRAAEIMATTHGTVGGRIAQAASEFCVQWDHETMPPDLSAEYRALVEKMTSYREPDDNNSLADDEEISRRIFQLNCDLMSRASN